MNSIGIVLPVKNEMAHIRDIVSSIPVGMTVICVDNNSSDASANLIDELRQSRPGLVLLEDVRENNGIGYGYACQTGMDYAESDFIVCLDADGTYPVDKVAEVVAYMKDRSLDMVLCSRYPAKKGSVYAMHTRMGTWLLGCLGRMTHGVWLSDIVSGMWVIRRETYESLRLKEGGWDFSLEIKLAAATSPGVRFAEYPISQSRRLGVSKQKYLRTGIGHALWLVRHRVSKRALSE